MPFYIRTSFLITLSVLLGILAGIGGYTFKYAEGFSYLSDDPSSCANCHIMYDHYESWKKSSHHTVAVCNDCHIPHSIPMKYIAKTRNGYNHSKAFTLQNYQEPIRITPYNEKILKNNCIRCHREMVSTMLSISGENIETIKCNRCHRQVGH